MLGEIEVIFDNDPIYTIEAMSYCTIGQLEQEKFLDVLNKFPIFKQKMINQILENPYDLDREYFVDTCRKNIIFLKDATDM